MKSDSSLSLSLPLSLSLSLSLSSPPHLSSDGAAGCGLCRLQHTSLLRYSKQEGLGVADLSKFDWLLTSPHEAERFGLIARFDGWKTR